MSLKSTESHTLEDLIMGYQQYLFDKEILPHSVKKYTTRVKYFIAWTAYEGHKEIRYPEMMEYIRYCREEGKNTRQINDYLRSTRHFFDYLNKEKLSYLNPIRDYNPAASLQVKGTIHKIRTDYLTEEELNELYEKYQGKHKILLGLFVYQGLKVGEIERLEKIHFDLKKGTVYVPGTIRGKSRTLKLVSEQLYELMNHISKMKRASLLGYPLQNQTQGLCKKLRLINDNVTNSRQLRGSRISYWVRKYDIREAQYLAGHRTVSATEKYKEVNLEDLQEQVNKYHPLG